MRKHPIQNVHIDDNGIRRFVENELIRRLVDAYPGGLNSLIIQAKDRGKDGLEDYDQLLQLIGYSVDGFWECACSGHAMKQTVSAADKKRPVVIYKAKTKS